MLLSAQVGVHEKGTFSLMDMIRSARSKAGFRKAGAMATFVGVVRGENSKGEKVQKLELEAYEDKANEILASICDSLKKKPGIVDVQVHHLLGEFGVGEDIVYVLAAGSHRRDVFSVLEEAVERYKKEAPIFKKEYVKTGKGKLKASWISEGKGASKV